MWYVLVHCDETPTLNEQQSLAKLKAGVVMPMWRRVLVISIIGAILGAIVGWIIQTFEPIGSASVTEVMLSLALAGAIAVNFTVWIIRP